METTWRSAAWCAPYCLFVIIGIKTALILKHSDNPLFLWPQVWFDAHKVGALRFPVHHVPFKQCHQREELVLLVFNDVWPLMAIHINPLLYPCVPPSECKKPPPCHALQQPISDNKPKHWEDIFVKGMMELSGGHFAPQHTQ